MIGLTGGIAFGIRIVLLRAGLLISSTQLYAINWVIVAICGGAGGLALIWFQRYALVRRISSPLLKRPLIFMLAIRLRLHRDLPDRPRPRSHHGETRRHECRSAGSLRP
jgi:hypothetical protein